MARLFQKILLALTFTVGALGGINGLRFNERAEKAYKDFITANKSFMSGTKKPSEEALKMFCYFVTYANSERPKATYRGEDVTYDDSFRLIKHVFNFGIIVDEETAIESPNVRCYKVLLVLPHLGKVTDYTSDQYGSLQFSTFFLSLTLFEGKTP